MRPLPLIPLGLALLLLAGGCGTPPDLRQRGADVPVPSKASPTETPAYPPGFTPRATPSPTPSPAPSATPFPVFTTAPCGSKPKAEEVIALVKRETAIEPSKALKGPLCSGTWQYTVLEVPGHDPVQVVTRDSLKLVASGTEVCSVEVRLQAPSGIKAEAGCSSL